MNSSFSRGRLRCVMVALVAAAFAAPAAEAGHAPGEDPAATAPRHALNSAAQSSTPTRWKASPFEVDRLGPKRVPLHHSLSITPVNVVKIVRPAGFDWADAAVGAAASGLVVALVAALAILVTRRSRKPRLPERSELASA